MHRLKPKDERWGRDPSKLPDLWTMEARGAEASKEGMMEAGEWYKT